MGRYHNCEKVEFEGIPIMLYMSLWLWRDFVFFLFLTLYVLNFQQKQNMYLQFVSFLHIDMTQVVKILPHVRQGAT